jgi:hypothetical protein
MKKQNAGLPFTFHFYFLFSAFSVAENVSIKNNKLCETNPISQKPKMNLNRYTTKNYDNKSGFLTMPKQTQSNPILSAVSGATSLNQDSSEVILSQSTK